MTPGYEHKREPEPAPAPRPRSRRRAVYLALAAGAAVLIAAAGGAAAAITLTSGGDQPQAQPSPSASPTSSPSAAPSTSTDPVGRRACQRLVDPDDRLMVAIESGMSDEEIGDWGTSVYRIAELAADADTPFVAVAGQDILDYMPDGSFRVPELFELAQALGTACLGAGLITAQEYYDGVVGEDE